MSFLSLFLSIFNTRIDERQENRFAVQIWRENRNFRFQTQKLFRLYFELSAAPAAEEKN